MAYGLLHEILPRDLEPPQKAMNGPHLGMPVERQSIDGRIILVYPDHILGSAMIIRPYRPELVIGEHNAFRCKGGEQISRYIDAHLQEPLGRVLVGKFVLVFVIDGEVHLADMAWGAVPVSLTEEPDLQAEVGWDPYGPRQERFRENSPERG